MLFVIFDDKKLFVILVTKGVCMISISRPINGISLNGDEFLLDENNELLLFEDEKAAIDWLHEHGVTDNEIEGFNLNDEDELADESDY